MPDHYCKLWLCAGEVDASTRERAKRVVYGIIYGLSAFGLSQQLSGQGVTVEGAEALINSFLNRFQGEGNMHLYQHV